MTHLIDSSIEEHYPEIVTVTSFGNPLIDNLVRSGDWRNPQAMAAQLADWQEWLEHVEPQTPQTQELASATFEAAMILHSHLEDLSQPLH